MRETQEFLVCSLTRNLKLEILFFLFQGSFHNPCPVYQGIPLKHVRIPSLLYTFHPLGLQLFSHMHTHMHDAYVHIMHMMRMGMVL